MSNVRNVSVTVAKLAYIKLTLAPVKIGNLMLIGKYS